MGVLETSAKAEIERNHANAHNFGVALEKLRKSKKGLTPEEDAQLSAFVGAFKGAAKQFETEVNAAGNASNRMQSGVTDHAVFTSAKQNAVNYINEHYTQKYEKPKDESPAEKERVKKAAAARIRLEEEISPSLVTATVRRVYNEEKGGWQFASMGGMAIGSIIGFLMGNFVAGAGGGGLFGYLAMTGLTLAGAAFGSRLAEDMFPYKPNETPANTTTPEKKTAPANDVKKDKETPTQEQGQEVSNENSGQLPAQQFPAAPKTEMQGQSK